MADDLPTLEDLRQEQPHAVETLAAALTGGRMHHAYVLVGPIPTAGQTLALAMAQALVCTDRLGAGACSVCPACRKLAGGNHPDVIPVTANDKDIITIDAIRETTGRLALRASESAVKVVLIYGADRMNPAAQNALLKTLEEPPGISCFLLTTARYRSLLPTVRSRTQRILLAPQDSSRAVAELGAGGIPTHVACALAPLCGSDIGRAEAAMEEGAEEVLIALGRALEPGTEAAAVLEVASDLGQSRERADLALALLEVRVRDALARRRGAPSSLLYGEAQPGSEPRAAELTVAADRLRQIRRLQAFHLNRTLVLEGVLLVLAGHLSVARHRGALT